MISAIETLLGQYVQLNGDGIASLNLEWIVGAIFATISIIFMYRLLLIFFRWMLGVKS